ncbi:MAG: molybdate ABC transporter substrate-binding protein [Chloroflexi bacterium]|nr:molybdate ABC transporter substrate-binding protein [Chloroflexota bacterium]
MDARHGRRRGRKWLAIPLMLLPTFLLAACANSGTHQTQPADADPLLVAAAADLQFAFTDIGTLFLEQTGREVKFAFGSTGLLTQQIENGAPFDVVAAANVSYVDRLREKGLIIPGSEQLYGQGRIVLVVNRQAGVVVTTLADLRSNDIQRIAIANPAHAPYGVAAQQALQTAGLWDALQPKIVFGENVRQTLQFVQTGDAQAGIVSISIAGVPEVHSVPIAPSLHAPINQAMAILKRTKQEALARQFIAFVNGPQGRPVMKKYGFLLPDEL